LTFTAVEKVFETEYELASAKLRNVAEQWRENKAKRNDLAIAQPGGEA
jgi:hypothetical protein